MEYFDMPETLGVLLVLGLIVLCAYWVGEFIDSIGPTDDTE